MATLIPENFETVAPSEADARLALESSRRLATSKLGKRSSVRIRVEDDGDAEPVVVPASAVRLFLRLLAEMSQGNAVTLIPTHAELTTQQAADLLNVSRPYVVKLLDEGKIPSRTVGKYRRVRFDDLMAYKRKDDEARAKVLEELSALDQELGLGVLTMQPTIAVYDACVLYPAPLRSLLMYVAVEGLIQARWTDAIHEEWMRNVTRDYPDLTRAKAERVRDLMNSAIPDGMVTGYEDRIESLSLPDPDDRHVLAAAIRANAEVIVTFNLKDFPANALVGHDIEAIHPDEFLVSLFDAAPGPVCAAVKRQREGLRNPPKTAEELLATLESQGLVQTVARLRQFVELL